MLRVPGKGFFANLMVEFQKGTSKLFYERSTGYMGERKHKTMS